MLSAWVVLSYPSPIKLSGDTPLFMGLGPCNLPLICAFSVPDIFFPYSIFNVSLK